MGSWKEQYLPIVAMVTLQCIYAVMTLWNKDVLNKGMSPRIFVFYRQVIATLVTCPFAYFYRERSNASRMDLRSFLLIFGTSFIGVALYQNLNIEGLYFIATSAATAMFNLVPAITFLMAAIFRLEVINLKKLSSIAKILGTIVCIGGAISITFLKGHKLLNSQLLENTFSVLHNSQGVPNWILGCIVLFSSFCCYSLFLILQVPITKRYSDHLSLSGWMCFLSMLQNGMIALAIERDPQTWVLHSSYELNACLFSGVLGSGVQYYIQSWTVSRKGPLFSAMFNPLCTVLTTFLAVLFLQEEVYIGTLLGAAAVIVGLYVVLWGKAEEMKEKIEVGSTTSQANITTKDNADSIVDLEQPLLKD